MAQIVLKQIVSSSRQHLQMLDPIHIPNSLKFGAIIILVFLRNQDIGDSAIAMLGSSDLMIGTAGHGRFPSHNLVGSIWS